MSLFAVSSARPAKRARGPWAAPLKAYLFLLPMLALAGAFVYYPLAKTILQSVSVVNFRGEITGFAGLENYAYLFSRREFGIAVQNTLHLALVNVPVTLVLTLLLAWLTCPAPLPGVSVVISCSYLAISSCSTSVIFPMSHTSSELKSSGMMIH